MAIKWGSVPIYSSREWQPDIVLVHGDTTTTMAASLAAYYEKVAVGHVEAGLRTGNIYSPWPEEMNRRLTGAITTLHFAPTQTARENLLREGVSDQDVHVTGNTVIDALLQIVGQIVEEATVLLDNQEAYGRMSEAHNPYGDGNAALRIAERLKAWGPPKNA